MSPREISQTQALDLLHYLFEYLGLDSDDVSRVEFTADAVTIDHRTRWGADRMKIAYTGGSK